MFTLRFQGNPDDLTIMMSFTSTVLSLQNALGVPSAKVPIDSATLVLYILPPLVTYFLVAVLAVSPNTRTVLVALWPLVALLTLRAGISVDLSFGKTERTINNVGLVVSVFRNKWAWGRSGLFRFPFRSS